MKNLQEIEAIALASGFEQYSDFMHPDKIEYPNTSILTMTCTRGKFSGDVLEVSYNPYTGKVAQVSVSSQFPNTKPTFTL